MVVPSEILDGTTALFSADDLQEERRDQRICGRLGTATTWVDDARA